MQVEEWRLVGGSVAGEGRLEARIDGSWATVCPGQTHEQALQAVADVACRSLGMPGPALYRGASLFGNASLDQVLRVQWCTGDEARLEDCAAALAGDAALCGAPAFGVACNGAQ